MFYGNNTFAEDAFSSPGPVDASVAVTGISLATAQGDETITTSVTATPTGIALSATQNSVTIFVPDVTVSPTGIALSTAIGPYSIVTDTETTIVVGAEALIETSIGTPVVTGSAVATPTGIALATALTAPVVVKTIFNAALLPLLSPL